MGAQVVGLLTILIALGSVWFLAYITTKFFGKRSSQMMKSKYMKVIDSLSMGFDKSVYLIQVGEQYILMHSSTKGFEFICNVEPNLIEPAISATPVSTEKGAFNKYLDFFKVNKKIDASAEKNNAIDGNIERLRDKFNNER